MTIKSSGSSLSFSEIATEFGTPPNKNLGAYLVSQDIGSLSSLPLDDGIPQSGQIKFSDFYGKRLNNVVDCHSSGGSTINAKSRYNNNNVTVVGGFRGKKASNSKIIINVNATFTSSKSSVSKCALRTGTYGSNIILRVDVGSNGQIFGAGGDGGAGSNGPGNGSSGGTGTSGLGIEQESEGEANVIINNNGLISAGFGGGGGGGGAYDYDHKSSRRASGGGGGGGAGNPAGGGGNGGEEGSNGSNGGGGGSNSAGGGGNGGNNGGEAVGGGGGTGGTSGEGADSGGEGEGGEGSGGEGGGPGGDGAAIRRASGVKEPVVYGSGTVRGSTSASGVS